MKIAAKYSHLNGEEFLLVHHKAVYKEIIKTISQVATRLFRTKKSEEKTMLGKMLYNPDALNKEFFKVLSAKGWKSTRYDYYVTTNPSVMRQLMDLPLEEQKKKLLSLGIKELIRSYKQTDFVKDNIAIEVQFGKYSFVAYDLFVKHLLFYSGGVINVGIEVLPMKSMQNEMSTGIAYYEGEVYNVLRHGRSNPPVPLVIMGVTP